MNRHSAVSARFVKRADAYHLPPAPPPPPKLPPPPPPELLELELELSLSMGSVTIPSDIL